MAPKGLHTRTRTGGIDMPAHPMVTGTTRPTSGEPLDLRAMRLSLRELADDAADGGDLGEAAELLLELGTSLCSTQSFTAGMLVLDEALDAARGSGDPDIVDRVVDALDRAIVAAS